MTYDPNQVSPPEPPSSMFVTCEQCQEDIVRDEAYNIGSTSLPRWICRGTDCLLQFAIDVASEYDDFKYRSTKLIQDVTHGVGPRGHKDFGRWDITTDVSENSLILRPNPDAGRYRIIQIGDD